MSSETKVKSVEEATQPVRPDNIEVMVVEDDQAVAASLNKGLQALGWVVRVTHDAAEALALLAKSPDISVIVTDIRMPNGSGLELAEVVRRTRSDEMAAEVIVITGHGTAEDIATAMRLQACDFLHKPFRLAEIDRAITKAARQASERRDAIRTRREAQMDAARLAAELAALRARLAEMCDASQDDTGLSPEEREKVRTTLTRALRSPVRAIARGACLPDHDGEGDAQDTRLSQLRAGVQGAVTAMELLEEFHRLQKDAGAPSARLDLTALVAAAANAVSTWTGVALDAEQDVRIPPLHVEAPQASLWRALTLCFEAAIEWARPGSAIRHALAIDGGRGSHARLTIRIMPEAEGPHGPAGLGGGPPETLRLVLARHLVARCAGQLACQEGDDGTGVISLIIPLAAGT